MICKKALALTACVVAGHGAAALAQQSSASDYPNGPIRKAMRAPDVVERYAVLGVEPVETTPEQFGAFPKSELVKWGDIIKRSGTKVE